MTLFFFETCWLRILNFVKLVEEESDHYDSGYQSTSSANVTNGTPVFENKKEYKIKRADEYENSENEIENDENDDKV